MNDLENRVEIAKPVPLFHARGYLTRIVLRCADGAISLWSECQKSSFVNFGTETNPNQWLLTGGMPGINNTMNHEVMQLALYFMMMEGDGRMFVRNTDETNNKYIFLDTEDRDQILSERDDWFCADVTEEYVFDPETREAGWRQEEDIDVDDQEPSKS